MYILHLSWDDGYCETVERLPASLIFENGDLRQALTLGRDIAYDYTTWERFRKPKYVYLYETETPYFTRGGQLFSEEDSRHICYWGENNPLKKEEKEHVF